MATYWVSTLASDDSNDGTTYALAKKSLAAGIGLLGTGDTLNIVNDGVHLMLNSTEVLAGQPGNIDGDLRCRGSSWASFGFRIRGTDSSGAAALATVAADDTLGDVRVSGIVAVRDRPAFCIIEGIHVDWTDILADATLRYAVGSTNNGMVPAIFRNCVFEGSAYGAAKPAGQRKLMHTLSGAAYTTETEGYEVYNCVFYNCNRGVSLPTFSYQPQSIHHNVFIHGTNNSATFACIWTSADNIAGDVEGHEFYHNTVFERSSASASKLNAKVVLFTSNNSDLSVHSNFMYLQPGATVDVGSPFSAYLFDNASAYATPGTRGIFGYNVYGMGTNFPPLAGIGVGNGFYDDVFAVASATVVSTQVYATDHVVLDQSPATLYNGTGVFTWTTSDGYELTLPFDPRPIILRTAGYSNTVPGAIPDSISVITAVPETYDVTAGNALVVAAPGVLDNDTVWPVDAIYAELVTNVAIGTLALSSDGGFTYTPPITYVGTVSFTYRAYNTEVYSNVTTVVITVDAYPIPPDDVDEDISYGNLVDTLPFFRPVLKADMLAMVRVHRNTNWQHIDKRHYMKDRIHWESTHRVCEVAPSARKVLTLGGVHRAAGLILETDTTVNATVVYYNGVTDTNFGVTVGDCLLIDKANVRHVIINNTSSSTATVQMAVYD